MQRGIAAEGAGGGGGLRGGTDRIVAGPDDMGGEGEGRAAGEDGDGGVKGRKILHFSIKNFFHTYKVRMYFKATTTVA